MQVPMAPNNVHSPILFALTLITTFCYRRYQEWVFLSQVLNVVSSKYTIGF
jgi:hypothetical protein